MTRYDINTWCPSGQTLERGKSAVMLPPCSMHMRGCRLGPWTRQRNCKPKGLLRLSNRGAGSARVAAYRTVEIKHRMESWYSFVASPHNCWQGHDMACISRDRKAGHLQLKVLDLANQEFDGRLCFALELSLLILRQLLNDFTQPRLHQQKQHMSV